MTNIQLLNRLPYIKGILILIIVLYHSMLYWTGVWNFTSMIGEELLPISIITDWLNSFHIYAFTFISGFIFAFIEIDRNGGGTSLSFIFASLKYLDF